MVPAVRACVILPCGTLSHQFRSGLIGQPSSGMRVILKLDQATVHFADHLNIRIWKLDTKQQESYKNHRFN